MNLCAVPVSPTSEGIRSIKIADRRGNYFIIDPNAFHDNVAETRRRVGSGVRVMQVIKGDGYGIGIERAVRVGLSANVDGFCAGTPDEALTARAIAPKSDVLLFTACPPEELAVLLDNKISVTVNSLEALRALIDSGKTGHFYFELDCGFGRFGLNDFALSQAMSLYLTQTRLKLAGIYTHFGQQQGEALDRGLALFDVGIAKVRACVSHSFQTMAAGSHTILQRPNLKYSAVDPGRLLYGIVDPAATGAAFRPVVSDVGSCIIQINRITGDQLISVGYNDDTCLPRDGTTGVFPLGWHDGLSTGKPLGCALVSGRQVPMIARTLLHSIVDLSALDGLSIGKTVALVGVNGLERRSWGHVAAEMQMEVTELHFKLLGAIGRSGLPNPKD